MFFIKNITMSLKKLNLHFILIKRLNEQTKLRATAR